MRHTNVLVIGSSGFVGKYLVNALVARGCRVLAPTRRRERAKHLILLPYVQVVECDVLVFGDDKAARQVGVELAEAAGLRGIHAGALVNSAAAEALTSILIYMNKTYKGDGAGIRFTNLAEAPAIP